MSKAGLTRKKIKVRGKSGKTFQRSVMVRAEAIGKRAGGKKLNSLNPWEARHTELVKGDFPKSQGSSGPGSSHSALALLVNHYKHAGGANVVNAGESYTADHAAWRREFGLMAARAAHGAASIRGGEPAFSRLGRHIPHGNPNNQARLTNRRFDLAQAFGVRHYDVEHSTRRNNGTW